MAKSATCAQKSIFIEFTPMLALQNCIALLLQIIDREKDKKNFVVKITNKWDMTSNVALFMKFVQEIVQKIGADIHIALKQNVLPCLLFWEQGSSRQDNQAKEEKVQQNIQIQGLSIKLTNEPISAELCKHVQLSLSVVRVSLQQLSLKLSASHQLMVLEVLSIINFPNLKKLNFKGYFTPVQYKSLQWIGNFVQAHRKNLQDLSLQVHMNKNQLHENENNKIMHFFTVPVNSSDFPFFLTDLARVLQVAQGEVLKSLQFDSSGMQLSTEKIEFFLEQLFDSPGLQILNLQISEYLLPIIQRLLQQQQQYSQEQVSFSNCLDDDSPEYGKDSLKWSLETQIYQESCLFRILQLEKLKVLDLNLLVTESDCASADARQVYRQYIECLARHLPPSLIKLNICTSYYSIVEIILSSEYRRQQDDYSQSNNRTTSLLPNLCIVHEHLRSFDFVTASEHKQLLKILSLQRPNLLLYERYQIPDLIFKRVYQEKNYHQKLQYVYKDFRIPLYRLALVQQRDAMRKAFTRYEIVSEMMLDFLPNICKRQQSLAKNDLIFTQDYEVY